MLKPVPVIIDGNLYTNAISSALIGTLDPKDIIFNGQHEDPMYRGRGIIIKTFINTVLRTVKDISKKGYDPTHVAIVWDEKLNGKYHKTAILDKLQDGTTYKSDRTFYTEEDLLDESLEEKDKLKIKAELIKSREFFESRKLIKSFLDSIGIKSYSVPGWEADDIDYIWGLETNKKKGLQVHCSGDSDWKYHLTNKDIHWQQVRGKVYVRTVESVREDNSIDKKMPLLEWASINFSALGSHNNLIRTVDPSIKRLTKKYREKLFSGDDSCIGNMTRFKAQKQTYDIQSFSDLNKVQSLYNEMLNTGLNSDVAEFIKILNKLKVSDRDKNSMKNSYESVKSIILNSKLKQVV